MLKFPPMLDAEKPSIDLGSLLVRRAVRIFWRTLNYNKTTPRFAGSVVSHAAREIFTLNGDV